MVKISKSTISVWKIIITTCIIFLAFGHWGRDQDHLRLDAPRPDILTEINIPKSSPPGIKIISGARWMDGTGGSVIEQAAVVIQGAQIIARREQRTHDDG